MSSQPPWHELVRRRRPQPRHIVPETALGIVILANAFQTGALEGEPSIFADLVFDGKVAKDCIRDWDASYTGLFGQAVAEAKTTYTKPAISAKAYARRYSNNFVSDAVVTAIADGLVLKVSPDGAKSYPLRHFDRNMFLSLPYAELPDMSAAVIFAIFHGGKAAAVTIDSHAGNRFNTLRPVGRVSCDRRDCAERSSNG